MSAPQHHERETSIYSQWASKSLAAGREPCGRLRCRLSRADEIARYALLYGDRIYVHNLLADYVNEPPKAGQEAAFLKIVADDLAIFRLWRPLIETGRIVPLSPHVVHCAGCLAKLTFGEGAEVRTKHERRKLDDEFTSAVKLELVADDNPRGFRVFASGPDDYVPHGGMSWTYKPSDNLKGEYDDFVRLHRSAKMPLPAGIAREQLRRQLSRPVWHNLACEMITSQVVGTSFVTDRALHVRLLNAISGRADLEDRNRIAQQYLTTLVPCAEDVGLTRLLTLREREAEAFESFREALNSAIAAYRRPNEVFTERDARTLHADVLAPKVAKLEQRVRQAKRDLLTTTAVTVGGWTGALTFGVYSGLVPSGLVAAATSLGLVKVAADTIATLLKSTRASEAVRSEDMYFLWRLKREVT